MIVRPPQTKEEFFKYYDLRWRILRAPWSQPKGSEQDELEGQTIHIMAVENEKIILHSRDNAVKFYERNGYKVVKQSHNLFGVIRHYLMQKTIEHG